MNSAVPTRRNDIDWLRIIATYLLFVFTAARVIEAEPLPRVENISGAGPLDYISVFIYQWLPPLFFLLAGWSRKASLQARSGMESFRERFLRLVIPFFTGCILICPVLAYAELAGGRSMKTGASGESFISFLPDFFTRIDIFSWAHLWFLAYLFLFTLLSWPFFTWLLGRKVMPLKIGASFVYLPIIPFSLIRIATGGQMTGTGIFSHGRADFLYFFLYFVLGFLISRYSAYERAIHQEYRRAGMLGIGLFVALGLAASDLTGHSILMVSSAAGWCCIVGLLGFSKAHLERMTRGCSYLRESSLPVYILHPVPVVFLGYFMIDAVHAGTLVKYLLLIVMSAGFTLAIYHLLILRIPGMRWLFGMKREQGMGESWKDQASSRI